MDLLEKEKKWARVTKEIDKLKKLERELEEEIELERTNDFIQKQNYYCEQDDLYEIPMNLSDFKEYMEKKRFEKPDTVFLLNEITDGSFILFKNDDYIGNHQGFFHDEITISHGKIDHIYLIRLKDGYALVPYIGSKWNDHHKLSFEYTNIVDKRAFSMLFEALKKAKEERELFLNIINKKIKSLYDKVHLNGLLRDSGDANTPRNFKGIKGYYASIYFTNFKELDNWHYLFCVENDLKIISCDDSRYAYKCYVRDLKEDDHLFIKRYQKILDWNIKMLEKALKPWRLRTIFV